jgi:hypothetical protein
MKPREIEYDLAIDDVMAFYEYALPRAPANPVSSWVRAFRYLIALIAFAQLFLFIWLDGTPPLHSIVLVVAVILLLILRSPRMVRRSQLRAIRKLFDREEHRKKLGYRKVIIANDGITSANQLGATVQSWQAIAEMNTTHDYLFIQEGSLDAYVVPRVVFENDSDFEDFVDAAQQLKALASGKISESVNEADSHSID